MNLFILGCGRSGTSLVAGLFRNSGFYMGDSFYKVRDSNPLGFFEDRTINSINEEILRPYIPSRYNFSGIEYGTDIPVDGQRWLARIPIRQEITADKLQIDRIREIVLNTPFCFKDPRFCYTLDVWRKEVSDAKFICVFRNPGDVVASILKEIKTVPYLSNFSISVDQVFETWRLMYSRIIDNHSKSGEWLFLFYNDLFEKHTLEKIEDFTGILIDKNFPDKSLDRSKSEFLTDLVSSEIFNELRKRIY
jgi:hypothetical protein